MLDINVVDFMFLHASIPQQQKAFATKKTGFWWIEKESCV